MIDPTVENRQGNDRGSQYQTGVYYTNESAKETVERIAAVSYTHLSLVSEMLKAIAEYAKHDRAEFVRVVQEAQSSQMCIRDSNKT